MDEFRASLHEDLSYLRAATLTEDAAVAELERLLGKSGLNSGVFTKRAFNVFRNSGEFYDTIEEMLYNCVFHTKEGMPKSIFSGSHHHFCLLRKKVPCAFQGQKISDENFKVAIELALTITTPIDKASGDYRFSWWRDTVELRDLIYSYACLLQAIDYYSSPEKECESSEIKRRSSHEAETLRSSLVGAEGKVKELSVNLQLANARYAKLQKRFYKISEENKMIQKQLKSVLREDQKSQANAVSCDVESLLAQNKEQEQEIARLRSLVETLSSSNAILEDTSEVLIDTEAAEVVLPESGILFVGGHPNLLSKLKQYYPRWTYVGRDGKMGNSSGNYNSIFVYYESTSHKLVKKILSENNGIPLFYIGGTNLGKVLTAMNALYSSSAKKVE